MLLHGRPAGDGASLAMPDRLPRRGGASISAEGHDAIEARRQRSSGVHDLKARQDGNISPSLENRAAAATISPRKSGEHGLETEAGIGVGVGIAVVILLLVCSGWFTWRYHKRRRQRRAQEARDATTTTPKSEMEQQHYDSELDGQPRAELHAGSGAGNTPEMPGDGTVAEMNGQGVTAELDHDEKAAMRQMESAGGVSLSSSSSGRDEKHRVGVYEMETLPTSRTTTTTTVQLQLALSVQELAAYPFQRDEEVAYGPQPAEPSGTVSPQSPLPRYQSVRSYERQVTPLSSPESVTQQQLQYYIGVQQDARGEQQHRQLGHVPSSEQELMDGATTDSTMSTLSSRSEKQEPVWQAEPSAAELNMLVEEHRLLEERKVLQLLEIERQQAALREKIAAAKGVKDQKDPGNPGGGSRSSE